MIGAGLPRQIERHQQLARGGGTMTDAVAPPSPTEAAQDADAPPPMARPPRDAALKGRDLIATLAASTRRSAAVPVDAVDDEAAELAAVVVVGSGADAGSETGSDVHGGANLEEAAHYEEAVAADHNRFVDQILGHRAADDGVSYEYRVSWEPQEGADGGSDSDTDSETWEPVENLRPGCNGKINEYMQALQAEDDRLEVAGENLEIAPTRLDEMDSDYEDDHPPASPEHHRDRCRNQLLPDTDMRFCTYDEDDLAERSEDQANYEPRKSKLVRAPRARAAPTPWPPCACVEPSPSRLDSHPMPTRGPSVPRSRPANVHLRHRILLRTSASWSMTWAIWTKRTSMTLCMER